MAAAERPDVLAAAEPFVQQCGPCDFGVTTVGCNCPPGDFRPVMVQLMEEVERLRAAALGGDERLRAANAIKAYIRLCGTRIPADHPYHAIAAKLAGEKAGA